MVATMHSLERAKDRIGMAASELLMMLPEARKQI